MWSSSSGIGFPNHSVRLQLEHFEVKMLSLINRFFNLFEVILFSLFKYFSTGILAPISLPLLQS